MKKNTEIVLRTFSNNNLYAKFGKYKSLLKEVNHLGQVISNDWIICWFKSIQLWTREDQPLYRTQELSWLSKLLSVSHRRFFLGRVSLDQSNKERNKMWMEGKNTNTPLVVKVQINFSAYANHSKEWLKVHRFHVIYLTKD